MKKKKRSLDGWQSEFRRYKILVKIFRSNCVEQQNLEIFTTGLDRLLELRRIHTIAFVDPDTEILNTLARCN